MTDERLPRTVRMTTALLLVATFGAGTAAGVGLCRWFMHPEPPRHGMHPPGPIPFEELELSDSQRQKVHAVFERHRPELDAILRETYPKVRAITETSKREVRELLTPEQRQRLDQLESRRPPRPPVGRPGFMPPPGPVPSHLGPPGPPPFEPPPGPPSADSH